MPAMKLCFAGVIAPVLIAVSLSACSAGAGSDGNGGGNSGGGGSSGRGGSGGNAGSGAGGSTSSGGAPGGSGGDASGGSAGASSGGSSAAGAGGNAGGGGSAGAGGSGGSAGSGGSGNDAGPGTDSAGGRPARVLIYTKRSTATHNASIPVAIASLTALFQAASIEVEASEVVTMFTPANLARFGAVVMVNSNGAPFGMPGTNEGNALTDFVKAGGGLAAFHAAGNTDYPATHPLLALLGGVFQNTGGGVRNVTCAPAEQHPTVAKVPASLAAPMDETYVFGNLNPMNHIVLRCDPMSGTEKLASSWVREEGAGRVFYTTLGHGPPSWAAGGTILTTHAWPGILWVLGR